MWKGKGKIPNDLFNELDWFTQKAYNIAKHEFYQEQEAPPEHSFEIDEAIALYLIARKLGMDLEKIIGKPHEELEGKQIEYRGSPSNNYQG